MARIVTTCRPESTRRKKSGKPPKGHNERPYILHDERRACTSLPKAILRRKYATPKKRDEATRSNALKANRKRTAREKAERRAALKETIAAARRFRRDVPAILNSPIRMRLFIALCEQRPYTIKGRRRALASSAQRSRACGGSTIARHGNRRKAPDDQDLGSGLYISQGDPAHGTLATLAG